MLLKPVIAALLALPTAAQARDWHYLTAEPGMSVVFIDVDSIVAEPNMFPIGRVLFVSKDDHDGVAAMEVQFTMDCLAHKQRVMGVTSYAADGTTVATQPGTHRWSLSASQFMFDIEHGVCGLKLPGDKSYGAGVPISDGRGILANWGS